MDKLLDQAPRIIEEAAKSPLGLLALMIMALSVLALLLFRNATPRIRVSIFLVVFLGFLFLGVALYQVILAGPAGPKSLSPSTSGTVIKLERFPEVPKDADKNGDWYVPWLIEFFKAQIIIDKGSLQGVKQGDYFVVIQQEKEIKSNEGKMLGVLQEEGSMLRVVDARPEFSICQLSEFAYGSHFKTLDERLAKVAEHGLINIVKYAELLAPITVGQKVVAIPQEEKALWNEIKEAYDQTLAEGISGEEKKFRYADMVKKADAFLLQHSNGYFARDALFNKGFAQFQLKQYSESISTFELFLQRYPFHVSASGAEEWVTKARKEMQEAK